MTDPLRSWSFSGLQVFETCPYWAYLRYGQRIPEPEPPPNAPNVRGSRTHDEAELFVRGEGPFTPGLAKFEKQFLELKTLFDEGIVELEENWGVDRSWNSVEWSDPNCWGRIKLDAFVRTSTTSCRVIDYKTGKSWGNEVKHSQQGSVYGIAALMRYPELEEVTIEFWYLDEGKCRPKTISRDKLMKQLPKLNERAVMMTSVSSFPAKPNKFNCRWCPYRPGKGGQCDLGVDPDS